MLSKICWNKKYMITKGATVVKIFIASVNWHNYYVLFCFRQNFMALNLFFFIIYFLVWIFFWLWFTVGWFDVMNFWHLEGNLCAFFCISFLFHFNIINYVLSFKKNLYFNIKNFKISSVSKYLITTCVQNFKSKIHI